MVKISIGADFWKNNSVFIAANSAVGQSDRQKTG